MKAYVFPGQGAQFPGMGKELFENNPLAKDLFAQANDILGFKISDIMFEGTAEELKQTKVTQPAIFLHSVILAKCLKEEFKPEIVAGHSLGEISALVANQCLNFNDGLNLVHARALAMQPKILLFDEPTSSLDPEMVSEVLDVIKDLAKTGVTMIIATHEMRFARSVADKIIFMDNGSIIEEGDPVQIFDNSQEERTQSFLNSILVK